MGVSRFALQQSRHTGFVHLLCKDAIAEQAWTASGERVAVLWLAQSPLSSVHKSQRSESEGLAGVWWPTPRGTRLRCAPTLVGPSSAAPTTHDVGAMEEDNKDAVMDEGKDGDEGALPADANETIYVKNLNERVKLDGEWETIRGRRCCLPFTNACRRPASAQKVARVAFFHIRYRPLCHCAQQRADEGPGFCCL